MRGWKINAVRVPLNESCWLGIERRRRHAIRASDYTATPSTTTSRSCTRHGIVPILELHWAAPGDVPRDGLHAHAECRPLAGFWADVAQDLPRRRRRHLRAVTTSRFPDLEPRHARSLGLLARRLRHARHIGTDGTVRRRRHAVARRRDSRNRLAAPHLLGGVQYSNALSGGSNTSPNDPAGTSLWPGTSTTTTAAATRAAGTTCPAELAASSPIVATEIGQNDCEGETFLKPLMEFLDVARLRLSRVVVECARSVCARRSRACRMGHPGRSSRTTSARSRTATTPRRSTITCRESSP